MTKLSVVPHTFSNDGETETDLIQAVDRDVDQRISAESRDDSDQLTRIGFGSKSDDVPCCSWGATSICGRRKEMEDSFVALPSLLAINSDSNAHLFGVYDGHGGHEVADYCHDHLHVALAEEIIAIAESESNWHDEADSKKRWFRVFTQCFHRMDDEVGGFSVADSHMHPIAPDSVGSTAVIAVISSSHVVVANCGDSRAVLCSAGKKVMPMSVDQKPSRADECARIEAAEGKVINWNGQRVSGFLALSRSIGDPHLRPYVVADPDIRLIRRSKED